MPVPPPLDHDPPHHRFCDVVLTGGVASGVVYPWAIVEIARAYWLRNIGGTSVGAMAAVLAAAAEYGRRNGCDAPFEVLRRTPAALATDLPDGRTRMFSLFQSNARGRRLMQLWGKVGRGNQGRAKDDESRCPRPIVGLALRAAAGIYAAPLLLGALAGAALAAAVGTGLAVVLGLAPAVVPITLFATLVSLFGALVAGSLAVWRDIRYGIIRNGYGLCKGGTTEPADGGKGPTGISDWLHANIQLSAGLKENDPPLTFRDLWTAPLHPGARRLPCGIDDAPNLRSINLQMITTNVTHGRPYRLPLDDETSRLFFRRDELEGYFPPCVLGALVAAAKPYAAVNKGEPTPDESTEGLLELPRADMPVVVAARLSLSFPLLFSAVPLRAIDYEAPPGEQRVLRCLFTDGGVSSNFPIHLFDAAIPRWPTFGMWLANRSPYRRGPPDAPDTEVWLPKYNDQGWGDTWNRFDPGSRPPASEHCKPCPEPSSGSCKSDVSMLLGFIGALQTSATDWRDTTSIRLPHVRNRVARLLLLSDEGGLNIGMPRRQILEMADRYGTKAGQTFVERFAERDGRPSRAWSEQRWIRANLLINGLRERLDGLATSAAWSGGAVPLPQAIAQATREGPVADRADCHRIDPAQAASLVEALDELAGLEEILLAAPSAFTSEPVPELRLRPPL